MSNVISLDKFKQLKLFDGQKYSVMIQSLHKIDLLEEMVKFNDELQQFGYTNILCQKGIILYQELLQKCQTPEMIAASQQMLKHLGKT